MGATDPPGQTEALDTLSREIVSINHKLFLGKDTILNANDELEYTIFDKGKPLSLKVKLTRADPSKPIGVVQSNKAYTRAAATYSTTEDQILEHDLERRAKEFYYIAHRAAHIIKDLPRLGPFKGNSIRIVRDQLIEHPEKPDSGVTFDSFSYHRENGPLIKGLRKRDQQKHMDKWFKANSEEFLGELTTVLTNAISLP